MGCCQSRNKNKQDDPKLENTVRDTENFNVETFDSKVK